MIRSLFVITLFLSACSGGIPRSEAPEDLMSHDKMVSVMTELVKLEAFIQSTYVSVERYHNSMKLSGDSLLKAEGVTYDQFDRSLDYYSERQDEIQSIYSDVLNELNKELGEIESSKE